MVQMQDVMSKPMPDFREGSIVKGRILEVRPREVLVDIGYKSEGVIPRTEFDDVDSLEVGDEVDVLLERLENDEGMVVLSKEKAAYRQNWNKIVHVFEGDGLIKGKVKSVVKGGDWLKIVRDNPRVHFYFVSVWNGGEDGRAMLKKFDLVDQPNVTILADPGPRGKDHIKQFFGLPLSWIPTTWVYKGGDLRYALNYGEMRFPVLRQFLEDSNCEWSHKGEPQIE